MCRDCELAADVFAAAGKNPHRNYTPTLALLDAMVRQHRRLELYAGDCAVTEVDTLLDAERHYTVCHYFRCRDCGQLYLIGACVRGTPIFKMPDRAEEEPKIDRLLWGRVGSRYA